MSEEFFISFSDNGITGQIKVVVTDNGDGTLSFTFSQVDFVGDFRAIYFDFGTDSNPETLGPQNLVMSDFSGTGTIGTTSGQLYETVDGLIEIPGETDTRHC